MQQWMQYPNWVGDVGVGGGDGPADRLMQDVFEVADDVHSDAMSGMVGSRRTGEDCPANADENIVGSVSHYEGGERSATASVEVDEDGAHHCHSLS